MSISSERVKRWRVLSKDRMIQAMGGACQCCGYDKCHTALAFHHLDPKEKDISLGAVRANPKSWPKVVEELKKCILVCHNCHSEIHAGIREVPIIFCSFDESFTSFKKVVEFDECPVCNEQKEKSKRFCSPKCANKNRRKVDWDKYDLLGLMAIHTISELEDKFGVSNNAIYKRRNKILKELEK